VLALNLLDVGGSNNVVLELKYLETNNFPYLSFEKLEKSS
jgi:hypothetical protein